MTKHYYFPGFHEPGSSLSLGVSRALWDKMNPTDQTILEACTVAENNFTLAEFNANNALALETLINRHKVEVKEFSDDVFKGMAVAAKEVMADAGASDPLTEKIYQSYMAFRKIAISWSQRSDQSYMRKRSLAWV